MIGIGAVWTPGKDAARVGALLASWKGVPYQPNGRSRAGVDCVGFAAGFFAERAGISYEMPQGTSALDPARLKDSMRALHLRFVDGWACEPGDALVLRHFDTHETHLALAGAEPWTLWSAIDGIGVMQSPFNVFQGLVRCQQVLRQELR